MSKHRIIILLLILLISGALRFWQLGNIPPSVNWDEAALGYNAYSIMQTGKDEFGNFLPITLRSFEDYKPALYSYLSIPSIAAFGLTPFAVRLPSALFGILAVLLTYFLVRELFRKEVRGYRSEVVALLSASVLAISPWHIQFSRAAFEANVALTLNLSAILFFLIGLRRPWFLPLSAIFAALTLYAYQGSKIFVPLLALTIIIIYRKELFATLNFKNFITFNSPKLWVLVVGFLISLPMLWFTVSNSEGLSRAGAVSIFSSQTVSTENVIARNLIDKEKGNYLGLVFNNRRILYAKEIASNYLVHYDPNWLFIRGEAVKPVLWHIRHQAPGMGNLYLWELPFILIGIYILVFYPFQRKTKLLIFSWFLIVPIPASITWDVPSSVRTLNFLPLFQIFTALGILKVFQTFRDLRYTCPPVPGFGRRETYDLRRIAITLGLTSYVLLSVVNFVYYLSNYFIQYNYFASPSWQDGYKELVSKTEALKADYDKIVVSDKIQLDQSYIFYLFYLKYPPGEYHKSPVRSFDKYEFGSFEWRDALRPGKVLYVAGGGEQPPEGIRVLETIYFLDGSPAYIIAERD